MLRPSMVRYGVLAVLVSAGGATADVARGRVFNDTNGNRVMDDGERGVKNVCVSNGREVVKTDGKGRYELSVGDDTVLFVIKPSGWITVLNDDMISQGYYLHKPAGSPETKSFCSERSDMWWAVHRCTPPTLHAHS